MQVLSVQKGSVLPGIRTSQISQKVDEALNNRRVDVALSGEVVKCLPILGRVAWGARIGCGMPAQPLASKLKMPIKKG